MRLLNYFNYDTTYKKTLCLPRYIALSILLFLFSHFQRIPSGSPRIGGLVAYLVTSPKIRTEGDPAYTTSRQPCLSKSEPPSSAAPPARRGVYRGFRISKLRPAPETLTNWRNTSTLYNNYVDPQLHAILV